MTCPAAVMRNPAALACSPGWNRGLACSPLHAAVKKDFTPSKAPRLEGGLLSHMVCSQASRIKIYSRQNSCNLPKSSWPGLMRTSLLPQGILGQAALTCKWAPYQVCLCSHFIWCLESFFCNKDSSIPRKADILLLQVPRKGCEAIAPETKLSQAGYAVRTWLARPEEHDVAANILTIPTLHHGCVVQPRLLAALLVAAIANDGGVPGLFFRLLHQTRTPFLASC